MKGELMDDMYAKGIFDEPIKNDTSYIISC